MKGRARERMDGAGKRQEFCFGCRGRRYNGPRSGSKSKIVGVAGEPREVYVTMENRSCVLPWKWLCGLAAR